LLNISLSDLAYWPAADEHNSSLQITILEGSAIIILHDVRTIKDSGPRTHSDTVTTYK
jgi:hypothetical protein